MVYVCAAVCLSVLAYPSVRLLQSVGYRPSRGYFRIFFGVYFALLCLIQGLVVFMWANGAPHWGTVLVYLVSAAICISVPRRCPLVFTARVKRLYAVILALNVTLSIVEMRILAPLQPVVCLAAWAVTLPAERAISAKYCKAASKRLAESGAKVIAVTGSFGKTSVKNMLTELLDGAVCAQGSCNTPDGIAKFVNGGGADGAKYLVAEFGARHRGDIAELCRLYPPEFGIVTGVCEQHLSTFKTFDNIVEEKSSLVSFLPSGGACVVPRDEALKGCFDKGTCRKVRFGDNVTVQIVGKSMDGTELSVTFADCDKTFAVHLPQIADYIVDTFCICAEMCLALGMPQQQIVDNAVRIKQTSHRMQVLKCGFYVVDDGYNANINGVADSCKTLSRFDCYKVAVAQGIVEGGKNNGQLNEQCGVLLGQTFDKVIVVGQNTKSLERGLGQTSAEFVRARNLSQATEMAKQTLAEGDILYYQNDIPDV